MKRKQEKLRRLYGDKADELMSPKCFNSSDSASDDSGDSNDEEHEETHSINAFSPTRRTMDISIAEEDDEFRNDIPMEELTRFSDDETTRGREEMIKESNKKKSQ